MSYFVLAIIIVVVIGYLAYQKVNAGLDIVVPTPTTKRTDLLYGYYGCLNDQVAETKDHINLFMTEQWEGEDKCIANILAANMATMLEVAVYVFAAQPNVDAHTMLPDAETRLRAFFTKLQAAGALQYVKFLYPIDEPNKTVPDLIMLTQAI